MQSRNLSSKALLEFKYPKRIVFMLQIFFILSYSFLSEIVDDTLRSNFKYISATYVHVKYVSTYIYALCIVQGVLPKNVSS